MIDDNTKIYRSILKKYVVHNSIDYVNGMEGPIIRDKLIMSMLRDKFNDNNFTRIKEQADKLAKWSKDYKNNRVDKVFPLSYIVFKVMVLRKYSIGLELDPIQLAEDHVNVNFREYDELNLINVLKIVIDKEIIN